MGPTLTKIVKWALLAFFIFYVMRSPNSAAETLRLAGEAAYGGIKDLADSAARFFDALLRR